MIKKFIGLYVKYPLFLSDFNETEFSQKKKKKTSNIKFHENPFNGSGVVLCRRMDEETDRRNEANRRFSQLCERA
jgi:hypothetical protein